MSALSYSFDETPEEIEADRSARRVARRASQATRDARRLQPTTEWLTTEQASELLGVRPVSGLHYPMARQAIDSKSRSPNGSTNAQAVGRLWFRSDIERVNRIRRECGIGFKAALRVLAAQKSGRI